MIVHYRKTPSRAQFKLRSILLLFLALKIGVAVWAAPIVRNPTPLLHRPVTKEWLEAADDSLDNLSQRLHKIHIMLDKSGSATPTNDVTSSAETSDNLFQKAVELDADVLRMEEELDRSLGISSEDKSLRKVPLLETRVRIQLKNEKIAETFVDLQKWSWLIKILQFFAKKKILLVRPGSKLG
ncbi:hypothetical protein CROQUDRAFT_411086 [Cronartium quercuum f. sp. fusiforme G11]|uniref:Uncharacterized protein n=1 Tax=Cronartium quercuum f. sp. fusiforme G11 TaxID=708437 RepID=A0A9P6TDJ7_9BASI|nr:hypothetical protein CROQUDRAFT_411086 [Cronartium quercuum f. sp. fusiforme G11]